MWPEEMGQNSDSRGVDGCQADWARNFVCCCCWHAAWRRCGGVVGAGPMVGWGCGGVTGLGMVAATWLTMGQEGQRRRAGGQRPGARNRWEGDGKCQRPGREATSAVFILASVQVCKSPMFFVFFFRPAFPFGRVGYSASFETQLFLYWPASRFANGAFLGWVASTAARCKRLFHPLSCFQPPAIYCFMKSPSRSRCT